MFWSLSVLFCFYFFYFFLFVIVDFLSDFFKIYFYYYFYIFFFNTIPFQFGWKKDYSYLTATKNVTVLSQHCCMSLFAWWMLGKVGVVNFGEIVFIVNVAMADPRNKWQLKITTNLIVIASGGYLSKAPTLLKCRCSIFCWWIDFVNSIIVNPHLADADFKVGAVSILQGKYWEWCWLKPFNWSYLLLTYNFLLGHLPVYGAICQGAPSIQVELSVFNWSIGNNGLPMPNIILSCHLLYILILIQKTDRWIYTSALKERCFARQSS